MSQDVSACTQFPKINAVRLVEGDRMLTDEAGVIGGGGNSGFQAINLAVQFGARKIILVGFEMHVAQGAHWHGPHRGGLNNPAPASTSRWRDRLDGQAARLQSLGVRVLNTTADSALTAFAKVSMEEALKC